MTRLDPTAEFDMLMAQIGDGLPNGAQYQRMSSLILDFPQSRRLARMDPFDPSYRATAMDLYLSLRGRAEEGYVAARDEAPAAPLPENLWTSLVPWSFRDAGMASEHLLAWGHILRHLNLPPGGSLLEYGPGSGQILLMAARMGYGAFGVDIDEVAMSGIRAQAAHLDVTVRTERTEFGLGFDGQSFDTILFYEAFHHAFDFDHLLVRLLDRLNPGGRLVLCGEPVVPCVTEGIPYAWGPRLDALSVFCMRRFGWMELGFTHDYLMEIARRTGWSATYHAFPGCGRAAIYVLEPGQATAATQHATVARGDQMRALQQELAEMRQSTSWRLTAPLRRAKSVLRRWRHSGR